MRPSLRSGAAASALLMLAAFAPPGVAAQPAMRPIPTRCGALAPRPIIRYLGTSASTSPSLTQYNFTVVNRAAYPNCMFVPSPQLPPCGNNANAARTWVDIYAGSPPARVYGFCSLGSNADLAKLWFARPTSQPPGSFSIVMNDRLLHHALHSNTVIVP